MTEPGSPLPRHILLATDLSARCDRAQDRALQLARAWQAQLTVLHALDVLDLPSDKLHRPDIAGAKTRAFGALHHDLGDVGNIACRIEVREGKPTDTVLDVARERGCDLIVAGIAGNDVLGRSILGSTTSNLARHAGCPLLVVKKKVRSAYRGAIVASDLSEASGAALDMGARLFEPSRLTLFHAFDMPFRGFVDDKLDYERGQASAARQEAKAFVAAHLKDAAAKVGIHVGYGDPAGLVAGQATQDDADLVIAGTHGRTGLLSLMLGSVAAAILDDVPCDVMIVPSTGARAAS